MPARGSYWRETKTAIRRRNERSTSMDVPRIEPRWSMRAALSLVRRLLLIGFGRGPRHLPHLGIPAPVVLVQRRVVVRVLAQPLVLVQVAVARGEEPMQRGVLQEGRAGEAGGDADVDRVGAERP